MATKTTKRLKAARLLLWLIAAIVVVLALLPVWFPWVLKPVLSHYGLRFRSYDRIGYTRFELSEVSGHWKSTRLEVQRVECGLPTTWAWNKFIRGTTGSPFVSATGVNLLVTPASADVQTNRTGSLDETLDESVRIGALVQQLVPAAELTNCAVQVASNRIAFPEIHWRDGKLDAVAALPGLRGEIKVVAQFRRDSALHFTAASGAYHSSVSGEFSRTNAGWRWKGEAVWLTNRAEISAQLGTNSWWPVEARINAPDLRVPARVARLPGYEDLRAALSVNLASNQFSLQTTGFAQPSTELAAKGFSTAGFSLAAEGNPDAVRLTKFDLQSPGVNAKLTSPMGVSWSGELLTNQAQFRVTANLDKVPGEAFTGHAEGLIRVEPHGFEAPTARFDFSATNVSARGVEAKSVRVQGEYAAAKLRFDEIAVELADGSKTAATGTIELQTRQVEQSEFTFSGKFLNQILPGWTYDELKGSGELRGPFTNLAHSGSVAIKRLHAGRVKPLDVSAEWKGRDLLVETVKAELAAGESTLAIEGAINLGDREARRISTILTKGALRRGSDVLYASQRPCEISFVAGGTNMASGNWTLAIDAFDWQGSDRKISLAANLGWPARGTVNAALTNVALADFSDFVRTDSTNAVLAALAMSAHWSNGSIHSSVSMIARLTNGAGQVFTLRSALATDDAVRVNRLSLDTAYAPTLTVTGTVPVKIIPGRTEGWFVWDETQSIALAGSWQDQSAEHFSVSLPVRGEVDIAGPELALRISGTLEEPTASLTASAKTISWTSRTNSSQRPRLEDLRLRAEVRPDRIKLDTFGVRLDGQLIEASGEWPVSADDWTALWSEGKRPDWSQAHGRLRAEGAQIAAVSRYLPQVLAPEGRLNATLELKPGRQLDGTIAITNAATRSLGGLTPLRDIAALVRFDRQRAVLESFKGQVGGQPVRADGFVTNPTEGALDYQVNLRGTNVPLARSLELLLRGDFDLQLRHRGSNQPPMVSGRVNLHDGLYVQHTSALVWSGPRRPQLVPPYFSVTNEPVADWSLDVAVSGDRFLRARTPVLTGSASANLKLKGSMREPVLTGDVRVNSGRILFPFGALSINQGLASFSGSDPQGPDLQISAAGRNYGYDVRLEAKGPANVAEITFSSTPPLSSEQILLMLTAGELPRTDYTFSSTARAGRLASFLGRDLLSRFLGTDPAEERLIIRTGEGISREGQLTCSIEYRLTDRWSLIGEYDEFNAFNADLKWKILVR